MTLAALSKPMIFSGPMVKAILSGDKSATRRVIKPQPVLMEQHGAYMVSHEKMTGLFAEHVFGACAAKLLRCPHPVGSLVWCRETFFDEIRGDEHFVAYRADNAFGDSNIKWKPAIFMPKYLSRITLEITAVRVGRLQEISEEDAKAEGAELRTNGVQDTIRGPEPTKGYRTGFVYLWQSINGKTHPWASNPWVFVYGFRRVKP